MLQTNLREIDAAMDIERYIEEVKQFQRVNAFLKAKRPDLAICTYIAAGVDVIRSESNTALGDGTYHDTDKAKWTLLTCP